MAFGGVWKASLTELSGGQRSLLALSLILAMLLFKPAPIYILDEARLTRKAAHADMHVCMHARVHTYTQCSIHLFALHSRLPKPF